MIPNMKERDKKKTTPTSRRLRRILNLLSTLQRKKLTLKWSIPAQQREKDSMQLAIALKLALMRVKTALASKILNQATMITAFALTTSSKSIKASQASALRAKILILRLISWMASIFLELKQ